MANINAAQSKILKKYYKIISLECTFSIYKVLSFCLTCSLQILKDNIFMLCDKLV